MMSKRVVGMANGVNANDAVNVTQLGAVRTIAQKAQSAAESAAAKADQALEKAESVGYMSGECTIDTSDGTLTINGSVLSEDGSSIPFTLEFMNYSNQSSVSKAWVHNGVIYILGTVKFSASTMTVHLSNTKGKNFIAPQLTIYNGSNEFAINKSKTSSSLIEWNVNWPVAAMNHLICVSGPDLSPLITT